MAYNTYKSGHGFRGKLKWTPNDQILEALDKAFYLSFKNVEPTNKRIMIALDVSSSMGWVTCGSTSITAAEGAAAIAMVTHKIEPNCIVKAFSDRFIDFYIPTTASLSDLSYLMKNYSHGGTDCSLPMQWAQQNKVPIDAFVVITDNETWCGSAYPSETLNLYRKAMGIDSKFIVVGMTATNFSIADPNDPGMLDVVGFDASTPQLISNFIKGLI